MEYRHEQVKDTGERYIVENGKVVKRYYVGEKDGKIYLRKLREIILHGGSCKKKVLTKCKVRCKINSKKFLLGAEV